MAVKYVYDFFDKTTNINLVGEKGENLARMAQVGLPVPLGFTLSTDVCSRYNKEKLLSETILSQIWRNLNNIENGVNLNLGDGERPLLLSVRVSSSVPMKGLSEAFLCVGINDEIVSNLIKSTKNKLFVWELYYRLISDFAIKIAHIQPETIDSKVKSIKNRYPDNSPEEVLPKIVDELKAMYKKATNKDFPQEVKEQLLMAITCCLDSYFSPEANGFRIINNIPDEVGCAVVVESMVYGNYNNSSGVGEIRSRNLLTGENEITGEYIRNYLDGSIETHKTKLSMEELEKINRPIYLLLENYVKKMEKAYKNVVTLDFCVQDDKVYILNLHHPKHSAQARVKSIVTMAKQKIISTIDAINLIEPKSLICLTQPVFSATEENKIKEWGQGESVYPGCACGKLALSTQKAVEYSVLGEPVILLMRTMNAQDAEGMEVADGLICLDNKKISYASTYAQNKSIPSINKCKKISINSKERYAKIGSDLVKEGSYVSLNANAGRVYAQKLTPILPNITDEFAELLNWARESCIIPIYADCDTPKSVERAFKIGAKGVGLVRTENMLFRGNRLKYLQQYLLSPAIKQQEKALEQLSKSQARDFEQLFLLSNDKEINIRLLDTLLHKILPSSRAELRSLAASFGATVDEVWRTYNVYAQANPQMGLRGCRMLVMYPELIAMQVGAICDAIYEVKLKTNQPPRANIIVPFMSILSEFEYVSSYIRKTINQKKMKYGFDFDIKIGCMLETPRACLLADTFVYYCDFVCFGSNDLTQLTFGFSRDDCMQFLNEYYRESLMYSDPFMSLDATGVAELIAIAVDRVRKVKRDIPVWLFGEQITDAVAIDLALQLNINKLSISPSKIPSVVLAQAHSILRNKQK